MPTIYTHVIHEGIDPFTLPQSKVIWVPTSIPGVKTPVWKKKFLHSKLSIVVSVPDDKNVEDIREAVPHCLAEGVVSGALTGIATGFLTAGLSTIAAGLAGFVAQLDKCLEQRLGRGIEVFGETQSDTTWGPWV